MAQRQASDDSAAEGSGCSTKVVTAHHSAKTRVPVTDPECIEIEV